LHHVYSRESWEQISAPGGALEAFYEAKDQGKICHIGITCHDIQLLQQIIEEDVFETVLVHLNYLAPDVEEALLPLCKKMNIGVVIMKPFAGGALSNATTALKYVLAKDDVDVVIPGMMSVNEVEKNVSVASGGYGLTWSEQGIIGKDKRELGDQFCRGCDYCQPCTQGIPISRVLRAKSTVKRMGLTPQRGERLQEGMQKASECVECGLCETRCPFHLPIRELLKIRGKYLAEVIARTLPNDRALS
jgi:predicted aldo/keto reductase-like oxidoreductase